MFARIFLTAAALLFAWCGEALAERRVALVIGNSNYANTIKLPNTRNDAEALAALLKSQGFQVIKGVDLTKAAMTDKLVEFAGAAADADAAMFFYAGHAVQISGRNLMVPIEADLKTELHADMQAIDVESVLQKTMSTAKVKIVLLDACRDNPFVGQIKRSMGATRSVAVGAGLAEMRPGEGALIAFATGPGQTALDGNGKNSPFTKALLAHLAEPGVEIRHALTRVRAQVQEETNRQQLPWENTNMTGFFYVGTAPAEGGTQTAALTPAATPAPSGSTGPNDKAVEFQMWQSAETLKTAAGYQAYLDRYPNGDFAAMAKAKLASLSTARGVTPDTPPTPATAIEISGDATQATEDALGLDNDGWRKVQSKLTSAGHRVKADGKLGDSTRAAIKAWQEKSKIERTGFLNKSQYDALMAVPDAKPVARKSNDDEDEKPRRRSSGGDGEGRRSRGGGGGGGGGGSVDTAVGAAVAIGAGVLIGRALRR